MLIRGNGELGEVSGDFLRLLTTIAIRKNTGDAYTPPGTMSSSTPMSTGTHHEVWVWAWEDCFSGIRVLEGVWVNKLIQPTQPLALVQFWQLFQQMLYPQG